MTINGNTKISDILKAYPWLTDKLIEINPQFKKLNSPMAKMLLRTTTVNDVSKKLGKSVNELLVMLKKIIDEKGAV